MLQILILGGTQFVGRWLAAIAHQRGHEPTLFHRGRTNPGLFPELEHLHGDRDGELDSLHGRRWDAVIDTCGYVPRIVDASCSLLADATDHLTFISTCSVYARNDTPGENEDARLAELDDPSTEAITGETYGGLKVLCERVVEARFPGRNLIVRPGLIVGPHDHTDRFTYWPVRIAAGSEVLGAPADAIVEFSDVRDLATFVLDGVERRLTGVYNVSGPGEGKIRFDDFVAECRAVIPGAAEVVLPSREFLAEHEVSPWSDLPLWTWPDRPGFSTRSVERAVREGLRSRPVGETVADTLAWARGEGAGESGMRAIGTGLPREREEALLARWRRDSACDGDE